MLLDPLAYGEPNVWALAFLAACAAAALFACAQIRGKPDRRALPLLRYLAKHDGSVQDDDPELDHYADETGPAIRSGLVSFGGALGEYCRLTKRGERALAAWTTPPN